MFSGIVGGCGTVIELKKENKFVDYTINIPVFLLKNLFVGASVANNGCCLTVVKIKNKYVNFHIINETLDKTNLKYLKIGDQVNIERSLKMGEEIGGHLISGHVFGIATVEKILKSKKNIEVWINPHNVESMKYIFQKGFICVNGISLTVNKIINDLFCVNLIPETMLRTNLKNIFLGQIINIEIDFITQIIVDTVIRLRN